MRITHTIVVTDDRDGSRYSRTYFSSQNWAEDVYDLLRDALPDVTPNFADRRNRYGDGQASGPLFHRDSGKCVGTYKSQEHP